MPNWQQYALWKAINLFAPKGEARDKLREAVAATTDGETPPEDAKGLLEDALKMARESNLSAVETEAATSALYRVEKQMNETWVDPRAELEDLEVKEEL